MMRCPEEPLNFFSETVDCPCIMNEWSIAGAVQIYQKPACGINYFLSAVLGKGNSIVICSDGGWDLLENMLVGSIFGHPSACNVKPNQTYFQHQLFGLGSACS